MKTATIRDLRTQFPRLEALLFEGESIAITKRKRVVAQLIPAGDTIKPDFAARFGGQTINAGTQEESLVTLLSAERGL
jgi:antitoxin (DNA-binding transcriptional repressor) of toxin-antitoxin stability system